MVETEYMLVGGFLIFYFSMFFIAGLMGIPTAQELDYENINVFTGFKAMLDKPIDSPGVVNVLYVILIIAPFTVVLSMMGANFLRGRA